MISIIIPTYRRPDRLRRCLERIAAQSYRDFEVCVVNDGGPSILEVSRAFASAMPLHLYNAGINRGHVPSRNKGLGLATGHLIALCDDDDEYAPDHLESLVAALPGHDLVYSGVWIEAKRLDGTVERLEFSHPFDASRLRKTNYIVPSSILYRRRLHEELGPFDEVADQYWDWDWVLRVADHGSIVHVSKPTLTYAFDLRGGNMSDEPEKDRLKLDYLCEKHGLGPLPSTNFYEMAAEARRR